MSSIADRWHSLQSDIVQLCDELGRDLPTVIAVTKTRTLEEVQNAIDAGLHHFGENYPGGFKRKAEAFPDQHWHYIGHLQRNDAGDVTPFASIIHTLDRKKLTRRLLYFEYDRPTFIQVNISGESSKSGTEYDKERVKSLLDYSRDEGLAVEGLMTIGSLDWDPAQTKREYEQLVKFGRDLGLDQFSIGMTSDWREALQAGATHLRIGTAIFGPRS